ncbi:hypothetical protein HMPREF1871_01032 [Gemelliphila asaccharolytica]|uniref:Uncharacterized protein n=1 Tax=Gemelliphila asaccharolytica TaxID=502393 RepID=A0ABR5TP15_9BACL|nr:hypothetical protein HMPREF1871_01032 [Gemella asaccharolytica]
MSKKLLSNNFSTSPALGVENSNVNKSAPIDSKTLVSLSYGPCKSTLSSRVQFPLQTCNALIISSYFFNSSKIGVKSFFANLNSRSTLTFSDKAPQ